LYIIGLTQVLSEALFSLRQQGSSYFNSASFFAMRAKKEAQ
jgi:hypothetical protein